MARRSKGVPWVMARQRDLGGVCLRCKAEWTPSKMPIPIDDWVRESQAFVRTHSRCKPEAPEEE